MRQRNITVLSPLAKLVTKQIPLASRLDTLDGKVMGLLWNNKPNGDILLRRIEEVLSSRFNLVDVIWHKKPKGADVSASAKIIREFGLKADFIVAATGD